MKNNQVLERQHRILNHLSNLPRRILSLSGNDIVTELVLYDLCDKDCFDFNKAAYFIDNPDFNCLKGVAGFYKGRDGSQRESRWQNPQQFSCYMRACPFNQKVRQVMRCSVKGAEEPDEAVAAQLAKDLGFNHHKFCSWNMKYDNHGLFIYEQSQQDDPVTDEYLMSGLCLLGFCPVF